jgi:glycosyltransferase involved in cell wall biosynthesis
MTDLTIVMPVLNEENTLGQAIREVVDAAPAEGSLELIIVDDGSTDGSPAIIEEAVESDPRVRVITHPVNRGKGSAIVTGLREAGGRWSAIMDADLEYEVADIDRILEPLRRGDADAVFGARGFDAGSAYSFWYVVGNRGVTLFASLLFDSWLRDIMTCHKVMATDVFRSLDLTENGFAIEAEITARLLRKGKRIYEVPVSYRARSREEGKKLTVLDGFRVLRTLIRCRFS